MTLLTISVKDNRVPLLVRPPQNIGEHFEQLREPILRSRGSTPTERLLAELGDETFLDLWSYPNPFRDQRSSPRAEGKELCDLLVVCDPDVIIFSEKCIQWPDRQLEVAWPRWYRKAIAEAAAQLRGAERWILQHPELVFLDSACSQPLPLALPTPDRMKLHRVVVARGATAASKAYFEGGIGSLAIMPSIKGDAHTDITAGRFNPFVIGDVDPKADFVHVFDEAALELVLRELDTITDFTRYLEKRAAFLRSGYLSFAPGEEELLSYYAVRTNSDGEHDFTPPTGMNWNADSPLALDSSHFVGLMTEPAYEAKRKADRPSYAWDRLIGAFTVHMLGGTSLVPPGRAYSLSESEKGLRVMARQSRLERRSLSTALLDALDQGRKRNMFFRMVVWPPDDPIGTAFFFLTVRYPDWLDSNGGYEEYRLFRSGVAEIYAKALLMKYPRLETVVGIATEPPGQNRGSSEDCLYGEQRNWSDQDRAEVAEQCRTLGIMQPDQKRTHFHVDEYPWPRGRSRQRGPKYGGSGNRKDRRARAARSRKA